MSSSRPKDTDLAVVRGQSLHCTMLRQGFCLHPLWHTGREVADKSRRKPGQSPDVRLDQLKLSADLGLSWLVVSKVQFCNK